jgi:hypothetical protein
VPATCRGPRRERHLVDRVRPGERRPGGTGEHHPSGLAGLAAHRDAPHPVRQHVAQHRGERGDRQVEGFGTWLNIPSKVAQAAAVLAVARARRAVDLRPTGPSPRSARV